jgi:DNA-binding transcriptional regulator YdaS (Cro superfamily)
MDIKTYTGSERGRATNLARALNISLSYLSQMASGECPISPERAVEIEKFTNKLVSRRDTHPDTWQKIWPELVA